MRIRNIKYDFSFSIKKFKSLVGSIWKARVCMPLQALPLVLKSFIVTAIVLSKHRNYSYIIMSRSIFF